MKTATVTELRKGIRKYLDAVEEGETVRVVRHGKPVAEIKPAGESVPSWKKPCPRLVIPGVSLSKILIEERRKSRW